MDFRSQLVRNVLGQEPDPTLLRRLHKILAGLDQHRFTSTDEFDINRRWESLCEKFGIKGYGEAADRLRSLKIFLMDPAFSISDACTTNSSQLVLKYDMLALLLSLSSGMPTMDPSAGGAGETASESAAEFWKRTLVEEPLEGDHWQDYEDDGDDAMSFLSGEEDFEVDQEHLSRQLKTRSSPEPEMNVYRGKSPTDERWDSTFAPMLEDDSFDLFHGDRSQRYWDPSSGAELLEEEAIREVLFVLRGYPGILFKKTATDPSGITGTFHFKVENTPPTPRHLSLTAFTGILHEFNNSANVLLDLRQWSKRILCNKTATSMMTHGQTCEATAVYVSQMLDILEKYVSELEVKHCQTAAGQPIISLLQLKDTLGPYLVAFEAIHVIVAEAVKPDATGSVPRIITARLLSLLYKSILEKQYEGENEVFNVLLKVYHDSIQPMGRLLDDWTFRAKLDGDISREFFVSRNTRRESDFVTDEFQVHHLDKDSAMNGHPLYNVDFMNKVLFVGRAIEIIAKFNSEMDAIPTFDSCLKKIIPARKTLFDSIDASPSAKGLVQPCTITSINNTFLRAGFPLLYPPSTSVPEELQRDPDMCAWLFDEATSQVLEDYISEPYIQATQKLRHVLWESCSLGLHLSAISSIYLMLEDELMHVFCESLFQQMDEAIYAESSGTNGQIDKLFMDAKHAIGGIHADSTYSTCYFDYQANGSFLDKIRFRYHLPWPINNYIQKSSLEKYTLVTTLLLRLKRTKHLLDRKTFTQQRRGMRLHAMRVRMIWFVNAFWTYVMTTILFTETRAFRLAVQKLENIEDITQIHQDYMSRIIDRCLLGEMTRAVYTSVLRILDQVQELAQMFVQENTEQEDHFDMTMEAMENSFSRDNEFISVSLGIIAKKGGFPWFEALAASLSSQE